MVDFELSYGASKKLGATAPELLHGPNTTFNNMYHIANDFSACNSVRTLESSRLQLRKKNSNGNRMLH
ncbi:hypothetical protein Y032_0002g605 [Ancylostoma ceylanicum]|uniref:Uncharacterized protein n=1 Tax=Ancylostoma ceylanicum TaxID=53326 RepID=A0A016W2B3_9BILA|nr:hypothetical protein Y032_0002g605 [Ancylostoma ceylanicum]